MQKVQNANEQTIYNIKYSSKKNPIDITCHHVHIHVVVLIDNVPIGTIDIIIATGPT